MKVSAIYKVGKKSLDSVLLLVTSDCVNRIQWILLENPHKWKLIMCIFDFIRLLFRKFWNILNNPPKITVEYNDFRYRLLLNYVSSRIQRQSGIGL